MKRGIKNKRVKKINMTCSVSQAELVWKHIHTNTHKHMHTWVTWRYKWDYYEEEREEGEHGKGTWESDGR